MSNNEMTLKDKLKAYTRTPGSLIVMLLVHAFSDPYICSTDIPDRVRSWSTECRI